MRTSWAVATFVSLAVVPSCGSPAGTASTATTAASPAALDAGGASSSLEEGGVGPIGDDGGAATSAAAHCASLSQLEAWQQEIDGFGGGYRPTGSPAHEGYIARLASELTALGAANVHTESYAFEKWTPSTWSVSLLDGPSAGPVTLSGYLPYSGSTGPAGVQARLVYVPASTIPIDAASLAQALENPATWSQTLATELETALATLDLAGRIALFEVPPIAVSLPTLTGQQLLVNDPGHTLSPTGVITRSDLSAMLVVPAILNALAAAGTVGAIGILDAPEEASRGEYAPFFGTLSPNLPSVYVDRETGASLEAALAGPELPPTASLVLDATLAPATSENLVAMLPGDSSQEIILGSHTDGPNSLEDNGPVAILALASCLSPAHRPRTVRIVLSGGHFVGSLGLQTYVASHLADLTEDALAVIEIEHLGAREWAEVSPGVMGLTGLPELQLVSTTDNPALIAASEAFAQGFPRSIVGTPPLLGEGPNFRILPLIQFITMPEYLLVGHLPAITSQFTDYDLMQRQVDAFVQMEMALAVAPAAGLGVGHAVTL
jgi:hypothetical protein